MNRQHENPLKSIIGRRRPAADEAPPKPQEHSLKHHGDDLQDLVDKATEDETRRAR